MPGHRELTLPPVVQRLLHTLQQAGYEAYVVGGCVRDSLMGRVPNDWDICTSALPDQLEQLFGGYPLLLNGKRHGTVAVVLEGHSWEITTFRQDGAYTDGRHPDSVRFVPDVCADLARRDFTVNAMAWSPDAGLIDPFGGRRDLAAGLLRCVGDPGARFAEDALRVLRAARFAAQLDFALDPATAAAALCCRDSVARIAPERLYTELDKLLAGPAAGRVLAEHGPLLAGALPEILPCIGCGQPGRWHCYDVWTHTAVAVGSIQAGGFDESLRAHGDRSGPRVLRWAALLHDLGKPVCRTVGPDGAAHFPGHNQRGGQMARAILQRLRAPAYLIEGAPALVAVHDAPLPGSTPETLRLLHRRGPQFVRRLCQLKRADLAAHAQNEAVAARTAEVQRFLVQMERLAAGGCYRLSTLAVNGADALAAGLRPGPAVGQALNALLQAVMDGTLPNDRDALLGALREKRWD